MAEANGRLLTSAGVRWARDVGSVRRPDPEAGGRERALALGVRDRWRGRPGLPHVRAAGTWIMPTGLLPGLSIQAADAAELLAAAMTQLDEGADLVKLYLDTPDTTGSPWTVPELRPVVEAVHARGARVTAHCGYLEGARAGAEAGVDAIEHGFELDADIAATMVRNGVRLVSTLSVMASWETFARTTTIERFASDAGRARIAGRRERAIASVAAAHRGRACRSPRGPTSAAAPPARTSSRGRSSSSLARASSRGRRSGCATWRGGELLGEPEAGVLREGGPADLVLVHGDPLSDPAALWRAWHVSWAG